MKLVTAIVRPHVVDDVRDTLSRLGVTGLTATEVKGFGRQKGHTEMYRGAEYSIDFVPKARLEVVVNDEKLDAVLEAVKSAARSGQIGDGKIFVSDIEQAVRIRTGEMGTDAL
jgi:nitrogen regulatory protein PII